MLRQRRIERGLSFRVLGAMADVDPGTIVRLEQGEFASPAPDKLARIADALDLPLEDVYAIAEYAAPKQLPTLKPYLRTKYPALNDESADQIEAYAQRLARKQGVSLSGPAPGEDEADEPATKPKRRTTTATKTTTKPKKKGGTK